MHLPKISGVFTKSTQTVDKTADEAAEVEQPKTGMAEGLSGLTEHSPNNCSDRQAFEPSKVADQAEDGLAKPPIEDQDTSLSAIDQSYIEPETELETIPLSEPQQESESEMILESEPQSEPLLESGSEEEHMSTNSIGDQENSPAEPVKDEQTPDPEPQNAASSLSETLDEVFQQRKTRDPLIQALLDEHGGVDVQDLAAELRQLAGEFGVKRD